MRRFRNILLGIVLLGAAVYLVGLVGYLFWWRPIIKVDGSAKQVVVYANDVVVRQSATARSFRLPSGGYTVKVILDNGAVVAQTFTITSRQQETFTLPTAANRPEHAELVTNAASLEPIVNQTTLYYTDAIAGSFKSLSSGEAQTLLPAVVPDTAGSNLTQIAQVNPLPAGQELFALSDGLTYFWNGGVQPLSLKGIDTSNLSQQQILFGSNGQNSDFVMAVDQTVYYYSSPTSDPVQVATLKTRFNRLVYGGGKFIAFDTTMPYADRDIAQTYARRYLVYPVLADIKTKQSSQLPLPLVDASISPDGNKLFAKYRQQPTAGLYQVTGTHIKLKTSVPRPTTLAAIWLNDTTYVYAAADAIWSYDITTGQSTALLDKLATPPASLTLQPDNSLLYTTMYGGNSGGVYRLTGKPRLNEAVTQKLQISYFLSRP